MKNLASISRLVNSFGHRRRTILALYRLAPRRSDSRLFQAVSGYRNLSALVLLLVLIHAAAFCYAVSLPFTMEIFMLVPPLYYAGFGATVAAIAVGGASCGSVVANAKSSALMARLHIRFSDGDMNSIRPKFELPELLRLDLLLWLCNMGLRGEQLIQFVEDEIGHIDDEIESQVFQKEKLGFSGRPWFMFVTAALIGFAFGMFGNASYDLSKEAALEICNCKPSDMKFFKHLFMGSLLAFVAVAEIMWFLSMLADMFPSPLKRLHHLKRALMVFRRAGYVTTFSPGRFENPANRPLDLLDCK